MSTPVYTLQDLSHSYGGREVLRIPRLEIAAGEILAVVGPSGAGKSTLLRLLNFLEAPSRGCIQFEGQPFAAGIALPLAARRRVTTVSQRPVLLNRSVQANVEYGLRLRGERRGAPAARAAIEQVGLAAFTRQSALTLSGGEAQRVALARAVVLRPAVLLLDEPTANLDPYNVALIEDTVRSLNRQQGTTLVLVTHNLFQAQRLAQRVAFLLDGALVELADADRFFHVPQDPRAAAFVRGEMVY